MSLFATPPFSAAGLAWTQILNGLGGGMSVVCVQVMVQASVPHEDMGIVISNLALWTYLFGGIATAVGEYCLQHLFLRIVTEQWRFYDSSWFCLDVSRASLAVTFSRYS